MHTRSKLKAAALWASSLLAAACAPEVDEGGGTPNPPAAQLDGQATFDPSDNPARDLARLLPPNTDLLATDSSKIRRGLSTDYDDRIGNAVVNITWNFTGECTAQVINQRFLLTAAHCLGNGGWGIIFVDFTRRDGSRPTIYNGVAHASIMPGWTFSDKDTALVLLQSPIQTCAKSVSSCESSQPDVPQHAAFQWFDSNEAAVILPSYTMVGYGTTDDVNEGAGVLRRGTTTLAGPTFRDGGMGLELAIIWGDDNAARPCTGDSGGPLVTFLGGWLLHTGIASGPTGCVAQQGFVTYSGLAAYQAYWVLSTMATLGTQMGVPYRCTGGTVPTNGLDFFICQ